MGTPKTLLAAGSTLLLFSLALTTVTVASASEATKSPFTRIRGLVAPVFTPMKFSDAGGVVVDLSKVPAQSAYLNRTGVDWAYTAGTTGESVDLTVAERIALAHAWIDVGVTKVIVHVGAESLVDAKRMAADAEAYGANAIAAMPPTYLKPATLEALVATMAAVAAEAPNTPFYYYHIPIMTGVTFPMADFFALADAAIPSLIGVKFAYGALDDMSLTVNYGPFKNGPAWRQGQRPNVLFGKDQYLLSALVLGADGGVGTTYNWNGELQNAMMAAYRQGDHAMARQAQLAVTRMVVAMVNASTSPSLAGSLAFKVAMNAIGLDKLDMGPPRLPMLPASSAGLASMKKTLSAWCADTPEIIRPSWCVGPGGGIPPV